MFVIMIFMMLGCAFCSIEASALEAFGGTEPTSEVQLKSVRFVADQGEDGKAFLPDAEKEIEAGGNRAPGLYQRVVDNLCCCVWCYAIAEEQTCKGAMMRWLFLPKTSKQEKFKAAFWITSALLGPVIVSVIILAAIFGSPSYGTSA